MGMHWHGFFSAVDGSTIKPGGQPERTYGDPGFQSNEIPPFVTHEWLRRPRQVKGTFHDVNKAVAWMAEQYREKVAPLLKQQQVDEALAPIEDRLERAAAELPSGMDIVWGYWLTNARLASVSMIGCPNRWGADVPCPTGTR
jgi:hypothetical protein